MEAARLGDGWLASAYNTTPDGFADAWKRLRGYVSEAGKDAGSFPNGLATMWFHITDDHHEAERVFSDRLQATIHCPAEVLRDRLPIGSGQQFAEKLIAYREAGVQRVFIWPMVDEVHQLEAFAETVRPLLDA